MPWLAAIGVFVAGYGISTGAAMMIGGAIVGAAVGGLYAAFTGGNILKGVLFGAVGGAVVGGAGAYIMAGAGAFSGGAAGAAGGSSTTVVATGASGQQVGSVTMGSNFVGGQAAFGGSKVGAGAFSAKGMIETSAAAMSLGAAFMKGGFSGVADADRDAELAMREKEMASREKISGAQIEAQLKAAGAQADVAMKGIEERERTAANALAENANQFKETLGWKKFEYGDAKEEEKKARDRQLAGVSEASKYVSGNAKSVSLVQSNRQRRTLPRPVWSGDQPQTAQMSLQPPQQQAAPQTGILSTGATA